MTHEVQSERRDATLLLTIARPHVKNALTRDVLLALTEAFREAEGDASVRVVVLTGAGGSFSSGLDLKAAMSDPALLAAGPEAALAYFHDLVRALVASTKPVLACVDGAAVGFGCDLALACDLRIASEAAYFQEKFVRIGLMPDGGGTYWLPRLVGPAKALEMMLLATPLTAEEALRLGVVARVVPPADALSTTLTIAAELAAGPPLALSLIKQTMRANLHRTFLDALDAERVGQVRCLESADFREGVMAFLEKRTPRFRGE